MAEMEITRNERVLDAQGMEIGKVIHVIVDGNTRQVTDLVVERDGNEMTVPLAAVTRGTGHTLMLTGTGTQTASGMRFDRAAYHEVDEDEVVTMPERPVAGEATLERVSKDKATVEETAGTAPRAATPPPVPRKAAPNRATRATRADEEITVPVVEEQLQAGVREREAGRFHLVKTVREEQQSIDVPLQHEEVYITETAANRPATEADLAALDRDIDIPLRSQEAVVSKEARVTGEVDVRKETVTETKQVSDTVRREEVHVEGGDTARVHTEGNRTGNPQSRARAMSETDRARYSRFTDAERTQYDALAPEQQQRWAADYDRRNPIEKVADKVTGRG